MAEARSSAATLLLSLSTKGSVVAPAGSVRLLDDESPCRVRVDVSRSRRICEYRRQARRFAIAPYSGSPVSRLQYHERSKRCSCANHSQRHPFPEVLPGFYLADPQKGELLPQFFHLYPLWLALCFKLWRFEGIFLFNVFLGSFSVLLVVGLAEQLFSSRILGMGCRIAARK